ncbi:MAG: tRNA guanosine(34) transglycosylase Tgt [Candidatus Taylorbacteria bacterium]|nr:tRNA guanosine(34) transglycosylase Tgt [Candidatus Taylorbacteria bacterium]
MRFSIEKELGRSRVGNIETPHGCIESPAFIVVGTKGTVKSLTVEQVKDIGAEAVLANTYHLYLQPGEEVLKKAGKLQKFMNWHGPTFTDSGGFQAFSLGAGFDDDVSKVLDKKVEIKALNNNLVKIDEEGIDFKSIIDGSSHRFTPERSIEIQHTIGADIIFAFDECTSPHASYEYQKEAMDRTHRWAKRCLDYHKAQNTNQSLFGIVQGGRYKDLREESARIIGGMDFDGFGIGGSFDKEDIYNAVGWVNDILPKGKPRHLLGIGEPIDLFGGIENGIDTFDCVTPTRIARNGSLYTRNGRINILNAQFVNDFGKVDSECACYTCTNYTRAYLSHLFRAKEMLAATLSSIHNLYFIVNLVKEIRQSMVEGRFEEFKKEWLGRYLTGYSK